MSYYNDVACEAPQGLQAAGKSGSYKPPTPRYRLDKQKEELVLRLEQVNKALGILDKYPEMEEFLEATQGLI